MKPGDHPEFFRFPAPAGRSRESTIVLGVDGGFYHDGERIRHPRMQQAFAGWIRRHPDDGRYILSNGYDWCYLTVEGAVLFVRTLRAREGDLEIELFDGSRERLDPSSLRVDEEGVVHATVRDGTAEARFTRHAQLQLEPYLDLEDEGFVLVVAGRRVPIAPPASPPVP